MDDLRARVLEQAWRMAVNTVAQMRAMLEDYSIKEKSEIILVLRLRGGTFHYTSGRAGNEDLHGRSEVTVQVLSRLL